MSALLLRVVTSLFAVLIFFTIGCQPNSKWEHYQGGIHLVLQVKSKGNPTVDTENTARIAEIIGSRIEQYGIKNRIIKVRGEREIVIQLPPCKNPDRAIVLISKPSILEFKLVDDEFSLQRAQAGDIPFGDVILYHRVEDPKTRAVRKIPYLIKDKTLMTGDDLKDVRVRFDQYSNFPYISLSLTPTGAREFDRITADNVGRRLAIILDDNVYTAPVIKQRISGGEAVIEGHFKLEEANDLAIVLRAGAFPTPVKMSENRPLSREIWLGDDN